MSTMFAYDVELCKEDVIYNLDYYSELMGVFILGPYDTDAIELCFGKLYERVSDEDDDLFGEVGNALPTLRSLCVSFPETRSEKLCDLINDFQSLKDSIDSARFDLVGIPYTTINRAMGDWF